MEHLECDYFSGFGPSSNVPVNQMVNFGLLKLQHKRFESVRPVYSYFRKAADGCDGKAFGFGGSLSPKSLSTILCTIKIVGKRVVEWRRSCAAAALSLASGALSAIGLGPSDMNFLEIQLNNSSSML